MTTLPLTLRLIHGVSNLLRPLSRAAQLHCGLLDGHTLHDVNAMRRMW